MNSRPRLIDTETEGKFFPIATFEDLKETLRLMGVASSTLRPYIVDWYNEVFLPAFKDLGGEPNELKVNGVTIENEYYVGVTYNQLAEKTRDVMDIAKPSSDELHKNYLYPLLNLGFINKMQSMIDRRGNIYSPVEENNIFTMFQNRQDFRLKITDSALFLSRQALEEHFRRIGKYRHKDGGRLKYKLVDENGVEISVEELIDRYLSKPEICFITEGGFCDDNLTDSYKNEREETTSAGEHHYWEPKYPQLVGPKNPQLTDNWKLVLQLQHPILEKMAERQKVSYSENSLHQYENLEAAGIDLEFPPKCYYCNIDGFTTTDEYERHGVKCHVCLPLYPGPADIKKHKLLFQGMPWEQEIERDLYFQFELDSKEHYYL